VANAILVLKTEGNNIMRLFLLAVVVSACIGSSSSGADLLSVEIRASRDTKYTNVEPVLSAVVRNGEGSRDNLSLQVQDAEGISAQIRVSTQARYSDVAQVMDSLSKAGVRSITIEAN
jgi:biopolymer transport protein ExbD